MATPIKQHIEIEGNNLLAARLTERPFKAYLVANFAFLNSPEASAEHYRISLGAVYAAMSFYEDNREAIEQAEKENLEALYKMGMRDSKDVIAEIKQRMEDMKKE